MSGRVGERQTKADSETERGTDREGERERYTEREKEKQRKRKKERNSEGHKHRQRAEKDQVEYIPTRIRHQLDGCGVEEGSPECSSKNARRDTATRPQAPTIVLNTLHHRPLRQAPFRFTPPQFNARSDLRNMTSSHIDHVSRHRSTHVQLRGIVNDSAVRPYLIAPSVASTCNQRRRFSFSGRCRLLQTKLGDPTRTSKNLQERRRKTLSEETLLNMVAFPVQASTAFHSALQK